MSRFSVKVGAVGMKWKVESLNRFTAHARMLLEHVPGLVMIFSALLTIGVMAHNIADRH